MGEGQTFSSWKCVPNHLNASTLLPQCFIILLIPPVLMLTLFIPSNDDTGQSSINIHLLAFWLALGLRYADECMGLNHSLWLCFSAGLHFLIIRSIKIHKRQLGASCDHRQLHGANRGSWPAPVSKSTTAKCG